MTAARLHTARARLSVFVTGVVVSLYVATQLASPFLHHDLACHLKSRTHCTACVAGVGAAHAVSGCAPQPTPLADAGEPLTCHVLFIGGLIVAGPKDRSPPAAALVA